MIGERLKHAFTGNDAWILSYREECFEQIGLKPSIKIPVYNGALECEFRRYSMFQGKMKTFREEGGIVKTEEDKTAMAEKRRFKAHREFKKRLDEQEENAGGDIRSFTFHSLERQREEEQRREAIREKRAERARRFEEFNRDRDDRKRDGNVKRDGFKRSGFKRDRDGFPKDDFKRGGFKREDRFKRDRDFKKGDFKRGNDFQKGGFKRNDGMKRGGKRG